MDSIRNDFEINRVAASTTTESSFTLKLTGAPFLHGLDPINQPVRNG